MRITDKYVLFWDGEFSNFFPYDSKKKKTEDVKPLNIKIDGLTWNTTEQYFMYRKALFFKDYSTAEKIRNALRPEEAKKLGRSVRNFDATAWAQVSSKIMSKAVFEKFSQIESLRKFILSEEFEGKHFVEASPFDRIWGIGLHYNDKLCDDKENWLGKNKLGKILDEVRDKLKSDGKK